MLVLIGGGGPYGASRDSLMYNNSVPPEGAPCSILLADHGLWRVVHSECHDLYFRLKFTDVSEDRTASIFGVNG
jgi:hypothetical protein